MIPSKGTIWKILSIGVVTVLLGSCLIVPAYWIALGVDNTNCYQRLARGLNVPPTYDAVTREINTQVESRLTPGLSHDTAMAKLAEIAPISVDDKWSRTDGDIAEEIKLKTCFFDQNDLVFLIEFSSDGLLKSVKRYVGD
jgi:hypothetical protein